jgi:hypothetical protein
MVRLSPTIGKLARWAEDELGKRKSKERQAHRVAGI